MRADFTADFRECTAAGNRFTTVTEQAGYDDVLGGIASRKDRCSEPLAHAGELDDEEKYRSGLPPSRSQGFFRAG